MPLDIRPQTPRRQAMLVGVLLLFFLASLGFAKLLIKHPRPLPEQTPAGVSFVPPKGFVEVPDHPSFSGLRPQAAFVGKVRGNLRRIYYFELPAKPGTFRGLQDRAMAVYMAVTGGHGNAPEMRRALLANVKAVDLRGDLKDQPGFVMLRAGYLGGDFVAIVYTGDTPATDDDGKVFENAVGPGDSEPSNI